MIFIRCFVCFLQSRRKTCKSSALNSCEYETQHVNINAKMTKEKVFNNRTNFIFQYLLIKVLTQRYINIYKEI